ncbi:MAG: tyrosine-protein phosphatase [Sphingopyxis sp.]
MSFDRILPLDGIHNFRDYGGYAVAGGGRLKTGLLWRSAQHQDATEQDLAAVQALALGAIIDLRGVSERAEHPCRRAPGFSTPVYFANGETAGTTTAPHVAAAQGAMTMADGEGALRHAYTGMPVQPHLISVFRDYFDALAHGAPTLVHCFAGKDRTGVIVALFHHLMGVGADDMMADYLLTNVAGKVEERIAAGATLIRSRYGAGISDDAIRAMMTVRQDYLHTAFAVMDAEYGSPRAFAEQALGVDDARLVQLRALYVES